MSMTPRDRVIAAMKKESLDRPPVAIFTQAATTSQMDKVGAAWPEAHKKAELMAKLGTAQADVFGFECVRAPFCLTAEAERLGCKVQVEKKDAAPMIKEHPFHFDPMAGEFDSPSGLMSPEEFLKGGRVAEAIKAIGLMKKSHGKEYAIVAGNTGPFTLAGHMVNTENVVFGMMMAPEEVANWVKSINPIVKKYTQALADAGADAIQMSEPSASTDMIAPDMFDDASGKYLKESLAKVKNAFSVLHICGDTYPILDGMIGTGVSGLSIEEKVDPAKAVAKVAKRAALIGNVGSVRPMFQGTPAEVKAAAANCVKAGFNVISSGCGIVTATPDANMKMLVDTVKASKK
ncbi:methanol-specific methylcobalamin: coenzyme M methyltransferase [Candidatus Methanoplasma termitum]|uniref:MtAA1 protein n=1 Tax=Candidatus Methanoplasma termitum TaxID=1577791 RepID=A0A0A7LF42_9ARCH|nr:MtaA/CmuA family methyltransferase [Candidatus Methanoplasma termitum]AIZ56096.1 methanol-specific methylcobalamin: coenzyme M methyltransferase [Candidatus Methanoplasma termitum]MCL2333774.1 MtaA/CmuA family methyltransferase [Candidatus Methanoplasma sp.]